MPLLKNRPPAGLLVVLLLAAALPLLAAFQYSWLAQLSEADQYRRSIFLRGSTFWFGSDFDRELAHIYQTFQVDPDQGPPAEQLGLQYGEWVNNTQFPSLIDRLYWIEAGEDELRIEQFNGTDHLVALGAWPEDLDAVKKSLHRYSVEYARYRAQRELQRNGPQRQGPEPPAAVDPLWSDIPGLVVQQFLLRYPTARGQATRPLAWVVVSLSTEVIERDLFPALEAQHFAGEQEPAFDLAVTRLDAPEVLVYTSRPGLTAAHFAEPDEDTRLFSLRPRDFPLMSRRNRLYWNQVGEIAEPRWQLLVQHEAGSLEAAVAAVRNRNLAIGFGVLLLLAGSVLMIVVSTRRAQRLAEQQMEFVAGISHELRTPLTVIRSAGENLADAVIHDPSRTRQYGEMISREGRRLSDMVERVLLFSRIQSGHLQYDLGPVRIGDVVEEALEASQGLALERSITLRKQVPDDLPIVAADDRALKSALQNLLSNAIKYSTPGSSVWVRARHSRSERGPEVQMIVEDEGQGIPATEQRAIFQPFYRGRRAREAQAEGSGLGLSLVRQIMEAQGGSVTLSSVPGRGSTFVLHLPLDEDDGRDAEADPADRG